MKKIVSLVLAAMVVSAGVMHAAKADKAAAKVALVSRSAELTTSERVFAPVSVLVEKILKMDLTENAGRLEAKQAVNGEFQGLIDSNAGLDAIVAWCHGLIEGVKGNENARQLIADIIAVQPEIEHALALIMTAVADDDYVFKKHLDDFNAALTTIKTHNDDLESALQVRQNLNAACAAALDQLVVFLGNVDTNLTTTLPKDRVKVVSMWDQYKKMMSQPAAK